MGTSLREPSDRFTPFLRWMGTLAAVAAGFGIALTANLVHDFQVRSLRLLGSIPVVYLPVAAILGVGLIYLLTRYAEVTLALFYIVGLFKADPRLAATPMDLTLAVAGVISFSVLIRVFFLAQQPKLPKAYAFYLPLICMMFFSLLYTPDFDAGLEKALRFVLLTCLGVFSALVLLDTPKKLWRFMITILFGGVIFAINSFAMLGGETRLVSPSGLNTELGFATSFAMVVVWALLFPSLPFARRLLLYPVIGILVVALIGSGGRFANISACVCIGLSIFFCRRLIGDMVIMGALAVLTLPFVPIPQASYDYLGSLTHPPQAFASRGTLMDWGIRIFAEHPYLGVGIQGYRFHTPDPVNYNFPHNIILELGAELGLIAVAAFIGLLLCSFWEIYRQLRDPNFKYRLLSQAVFVVLVLVCLDASVSGEINEHRLMWFILGLPFVVKNFSARTGENTSEAENAFLSVGNAITCR